MKILFCDNNLYGFLNFRREVMDSYAKRGNDVVIVAPQNCYFDVNEVNVKYIPLNFVRSNTNPFKDIIYFFKLLGVYRRERPDYIFHYTIKPNIYGSIAAKLCGIPSTAMVAGLGYIFSSKSLSSKLALALYRFALRFPEHVFVLNKGNVETLLKMRLVREDQVVLLPGGEGINLKKYKAAQ